MGALLHFVMYLPRTSALSRELEPTTDIEKWADGTVVAPMLADLIDMVGSLGAALLAKGTGRMPRHVAPYRRPWGDGGDWKLGGKDSAIPIADFEQWWDSKEVSDDAQG